MIKPHHKTKFLHRMMVKTQHFRTALQDVMNKPQNIMN